MSKVNSGVWKKFEESCSQVLHGVYMHVYVSAYAIIYILVIFSVDMNVR